MSPIWILVLLPALAMADSFSDADKNNDTFLSEEEIFNYAKRWDGNNDGILSQLDFYNMMKVVQPSFAKFHAAMFKALDVNGDLKLTNVDSAAAFKKIDVNKNGKAEKSEFTKWGSFLSLDAFAVRIVN
ncbi:uncharacterized protein LOC131954936 [Physella acuta]|uniref:uncharacterized protein LOC131954936 n=1 Tax=Physella acuta TaxID=109671 RepID=UPI0027DD3F14|nr:uncharacterized protein LOC131954936 [Physella acuta]XP_059174770.1 uncharacterized protein LOC131954936 [Physella acuta]